MVYVITVRDQVMGVFSDQQRAVDFRTDLIKEYGNSVAVKYWECNVQ